MRLSTKGQYGVRAMLDLALNYGSGPLALKDISEREEISEHYLEQLVAVLRKAGLVKSTRGAQGGYTLSTEPSKITVGDILRALEGPLAPVECVLEGGETECKRAGSCVSRLVWQKIRDSLNAVVDSITLQDMVDDYYKLQGNNNMMYYI